MNLSFFPSKRIALYMARIFLLRTLAVLAGLVVVLMTLDLLGESGSILAYPGNGEEELWRYAGLRLPQLISRFLPFSVLLGTLITFASLNQNSEIVSMKAAGISAHQIIAPLIVASLGIAALTFVFQEHVTTKATATLRAWEDVDFGPPPKETGVRRDVWVREGDNLIHADAVGGSGSGTRLIGVTLYERSGETLSGVISAERARPSEGGWLLENAERFDIEGAATRRLPEGIVIARGVTADRFTLATVQADEQDFQTLRQSIGELKASGRPTASLEAGLWHKLSGPLSAVLMPLLAAVAAFGLARSGQLLLRAVIGMALGFLYFVVDNFALALGNFGAYPPMLAAWAPFLLFLLVGEAVLIRTEE